MIERKDPSKDDISHAAYALYLQRGCEPGKDVEDWVSAVELACRPLMRDNPAASSEPELMREPEDNCCKTVCRLLLVLLRLFSAYSAEMLFSTPNAMGLLLVDAWICGRFHSTPHNLGAVRETCRRILLPYRHGLKSH